jgi:predicted RecA/RadA family phage recombinase
MTTTADNTIVQDYTDVLNYPILKDGNGDINAGDMVYMDTTNHYVLAATTDAHVQYLVGVAKDTTYKNPFGTKIYDASAAIKVKGIVSLKTTTSESYYHGTAVYMGADSQTVTTVAGSYIVGYVWKPNSAAVTTGASGTNVNVLLRTAFPFLGV